MKVKIALVQPESARGADEYQNAERAITYLEEAARTGAQLVCFPEGYPGPAHGPLDSGGHLAIPPVEMLARRAKELGVYTTASNVEENPRLPGTFYLSSKLISPEGKIIADHKRVQPDEPDLNEYLFGGRRDFVPGEQLTVVDTPLGKIGLLICSEIFVPELARIEMLMGAEIIIAPVNGICRESACVQASDPPLWDTWRCISRARAAENMIYVIITTNIFLKGSKGVAHVSSPEKILAMSTEPGILTAELDMDRLRWLRTHSLDWDFLNGAYAGEMGTIGTRLGQHRLRRPEIYQKLLEPLPSDWDYWYFTKH